MDFPIYVFIYFKLVKFVFVLRVLRSGTCNWFLFLRMIHFKGFTEKICGLKRRETLKVVD